MYNKVIMMGRIAHDLELKTTSNGTSVCKFSIAVDRRFQTKGEEKKTDFFNIVAWRQAAEFVANYFRKGNMIMVEGELQTTPYTDKNGNKATWYEINAERLSFTGEKRDSVGSQTAPYREAPSAPEPPAASAGDDTYPF